MPRRRIVLALVALVVALTAACSTAPSTPPPAAAPVTSSAAPQAAAAVRAAVDGADRAVTRAGADVGIAVLDRETRASATNDAGSRAFNAASLAKVLTTVDVLARGAAGTVEVTAADRDLVSAALGPSDDEAMNTLWSRFGGQAGITRVVEQLGLQDTAVPGDPSQWGEVQLSARDTVAVVDFVLGGLSPADRDLVVGALADTPVAAADGFDQAFGLLDPERRGDAAAKQGWLCCLGNSIDLHSAGVVDGDERYVVAILSNQPRGYPAARQVLDEVAAAVRDALAV